MKNHNEEIMFISSEKTKMAINLNTVARFYKDMVAEKPVLIFVHLAMSSDGEQMKSTLLFNSESERDEAISRINFLVGSKYI